MMKKVLNIIRRVAFAGLLFLLFTFISVAQPRIIVLSDILNEPDDSQSLVRLLLYSNEIEIEALVATTSYWLQENPRIDEMYNIVDAYGQVVDNLKQHDPRFPSHSELRSRIFQGQTRYGMDAVGSGKSTAGSNAIIDIVDQNDSRPVWILLWGGGNTLAQALYDVNSSRSPSEVNSFVSKIRAYDISGQDDAGAWMTHTFPGLIFLRSVAQWQGISPTYGNFWPESHGGDESVVSDDWVSSNIQNNHGDLGSKYRQRTVLWEGDTPSFLNLIQNGLNDPEKWHYGGWGGRFTKDRQKNPYTELGYGKVKGDEDDYADFYMYTEETDSWTYNGTTYNNRYAPLFRWRTDFQNNFAGRMDWCLKSFADANHEPVAVVGTDQSTSIIYLNVDQGTSINLDASASSDPDGDDLNFRWFYYPEPGTYNGSVSINNSTSSACSVQMPGNAATGDSIHIVLVLKDNGSPVMTSYRRVVLIAGESDIAPLPAPCSIDVSDVTENSAVLTWEDCSDNEDGFEIFQSNNSESGFVSIHKTGTNVTSYTVTGLNPGSRFFFKIRAFNSETYSSYTQVVEVNTPGNSGNTVPADPSNLRTEEIESTSLVLRWDDNSDNETGFDIEMSEGSSGFSLLASTNANATTYNVYGLTPSTSYQFRIKAVNTEGPSDYSNIATATTSAPSSGAPQITNLENFHLDYFTGEGEREITEELEILHTGLITEAEIRISENYDPEHDAFTFEGYSNITGYFHKNLGILSLKGNDTKENYEQAIRKVKYINQAESESATPLNKEISVFVKDGTKHSNTLFREVVVNIGTRSPEPQERFLNLFPNPASDIITITVKDSLEGNETIGIMDLTGKIQLFVPVQNHMISETDLRLDVSGLKTGVYIIQLENQTSKRTIRFIKQ